MMIVIFILKIKSYISRRKKVVHLVICKVNRIIQSETQKHKKRPLLSSNGLFNMFYFFLDDQHRVTIRVEFILVFDRFLVSFKH